jgi:predicted PurR-regulated permease PerM
MTGLASFGSVALNFLLSLLLSFLFVLERKKIAKIGNTIKESRVAFIYRYFLLFGVSFCHTFGKVMRVQVVIATVNCAVSMIYLTIAGFPYIMVLGITIFFLGLIPVAGAFISLVPLTIIAFNVGGIIKVVEVLVMIAIIHAIEAYFLNPKLMSRRTSLPVSIVFVILIVSERYLGAWGMLIGVPIFIYVMNVLNIDYQNALKAELLKEEKADDTPVVERRDVKLRNWLSGVQDRLRRKNSGD